MYKRFLLYNPSSSGVKSVDKRDGSGSHNWGTYEDDMKAEQDQANTSTDDAGQTTGKIYISYRTADLHTLSST